MKKFLIIFLFTFITVSSLTFLFNSKTASAQVCTPSNASEACFFQCGNWTGFSCPSGVVTSAPIYVNGVCSKRDSCVGSCEWQGVKANTSACIANICQYTYGTAWCAYPNVTNCIGGYYPVPDIECGGTGGGIPGATFSMGLNPSAHTLYEGQTKDFTITVASDGRLVTITKVCPAGTTCTFVPQGGVSTLNGLGNLETNIVNYGVVGYLRVVGNTAGVYNLTITGTSGSESHPVSSTLTVLALANHASCSTIDAPASVTRGSTFAASVVMLNDGSKTWNIDATPHNLGSQNNRDNTRWGFNRVALPSITLPGATATFNFNATAPTTPGTYAFDWEMVEDGAYWFSTISPSNLGGRCTKLITVTAVPVLPSVTASCSADGRQINMDWAYPVGYSTANIRIWDITTGSYTVAEGSSATSRSTPAIPGHRYSYWAHTTNANGFESTEIPAPAFTYRFTCPNLPNLTASAVEPPNTAIINTARTFSATITNDGSVSTGVVFPNHFRVATAPDGGGTVTTISAANVLAPLLAGESVEVTSANHPFTSAGVYSVQVCADKNASMVGIINESDENDNCSAWTNITVTAAAAPIISVAPTSLTFTTYWGAGAETVPYQNLTVRNIGNETLTWDSTNQDEPRFDNHPYEYCYYKMFDGFPSKTLPAGDSQNIRVRVAPPNPTNLGIDGVIPGPGVYDSCVLHFTDVNGKAAPVDVPIIYDLGMACPIGDPSCNIYDPFATVGGTCLTPNINVSWTVPSILQGPGFGVNIYRKDVTTNGPLLKIVTNRSINAIPYVDLTPPLIKDNTYYYEIEAGYKIGEANEVISPNRIRTNNIKNACAPIDLIASSITPTTVIVGNGQNFTGNIRNIGIDPILGLFTNIFQIASDSSGSGAQIDGIAAINGLAGGANQNVSYSHSSPFNTVGTFYLRLCADKRFNMLNGQMIDGTIVESDETNNCTLWTPINVITSATADIRANGSNGPVTLANNGDPVTISWSYANATSCTLDPALASINTFPTGNGTFTVASLTAGRTYSISCLPVGSGSSDSVVVNVPAASRDLTVIKSGQGTVISSSVPNQASQINCGAGCPSQTVGFGPSAAVVLTETPAAGRIFTGWSGVSCNEGSQKNTTCSFTMGASNLTVIANFAVDPNYKEF